MSKTTTNYLPEHCQLCASVLTRHAYLSLCIQRKGKLFLCPACRRGSGVGHAHHYYEQQGEWFLTEHKKNFDH